MAPYYENAEADEYIPTDPDDPTAAEETSVPVDTGTTPEGTTEQPVSGWGDFGLGGFNEWSEAMTRAVGGITDQSLMQGLLSGDYGTESVRGAGSKSQQQQINALRLGQGPYGSTGYGVVGFPGARDPATAGPGFKVLQGMATGNVQQGQLAAEDKGIRNILAMQAGSRAPVGATERETREQMGLFGRERAGVGLEKQQEAATTVTAMQSELAQFDVGLDAQLAMKRDEMINVLLAQGVDMNVAQMQVDSQLAQQREQIRQDRWQQILQDARERAIVMKQEEGFFTDYDIFGTRPRFRQGELQRTGLDAIINPATGTYWTEEELEAAVQEKINLAKRMMGGGFGVGAPAGSASGVGDKSEPNYNAGYGDHEEGHPALPGPAMPELKARLSDPVVKTRVEKGPVPMIGSPEQRANAVIQDLDNMREAYRYGESGAKILGGTKREAIGEIGSLAQSKGEELATSYLERAAEKTPVVGKAIKPALAIGKAVKSGFDSDPSVKTSDAIDFNLRKAATGMGSDIFSGYAAGPLAPFVSPAVTKLTDMTDEAIFGGPPTQRTIQPGPKLGGRFNVGVGDKNELPASIVSRQRGVEKGDALSDSGKMYARLMESQQASMAEYQREQTSQLESSQSLINRLSDRKEGRSPKQESVDGIAEMTERYRRQAEESEQGQLRQMEEARSADYINAQMGGDTGALTQEEMHKQQAQAAVEQQVAQAESIMRRRMEEMENLYGRMRR